MIDSSRTRPRLTGESIRRTRLVGNCKLQPSLTFNEDVVQVSAATIHRDAHSGFGQRRDPGRSGELAALVRIHDLGWAVFGNGRPNVFPDLMIASNVN